jgi:mono/diheme cytochrome c family protein
MSAPYSAARRAGARLLAGAGLAAIVLAAVDRAPSAQTPQAQAARTVQDGVFSDAQASRGAAVFKERCSGCHGAEMKGAKAPPLVGDVFLGNWRTQPLSALAGKIRATMPPDAQGTLTPQQAADLVSHILKAGGFPPGAADLAPAEAALNGITWPAAPAGAAVQQASQMRAYPPLGNMAQLMRGIFFPNSNLIFTVQTRDPAAPAPPPQPNAQGGGFSWVDWGAGIYGGWQLVDNAAIALADASPLMLVPGIRCENGQLAPVTDPEWIRFTEEMIAVSRRIYRTSQTRNQEAVSDATGDLADACSNCHRVYRDVGPGRGGRAAGAAGVSGRCMSRAGR